MFGLRLGKHPRAVVATTPRPTDIVRELLKREGQDVVVSRGSTYDNRVNLAKVFLERIVRKYEGTRLGRQELDGEVLDDNPGALWKRGRIEEIRVGRPGMPASAPKMRRIVVAVDPAVTANEDCDETGIVCCGLGADGHAYVIEDASLEQATPDQWGKQAVAVYQRHHADCIVGEVNNGGDLVEANVRSAAKSLKVQIAFSQVRASRGKAVRAEPVSGLYEQGRVHHIGVLAKLEDQMCTWDPVLSTKSPDRVDALVWGISEFLEKMNGATIDLSRWVV